MEEKDIQGINGKLKGFYKRWNIELSDGERWEDFKNRILNSYSLNLGEYILIHQDLEDQFFGILGLHITKKTGFDFDFDKKLGDSPTYNYLKNQKDLKKFLLGVEAIFWITTLPTNNKKKFLSDIFLATEISSVPLQLKEINSEILFYPSGAKLLDEKLINDNLDWLLEYPKSYELFKSSLLEIDKKGKERNVVDNLRLSLELLLKDKLQNQKSLENQKSELGKYLKEKNISSEISNLYITVIDYFSKFQNNNAKHSDNVKKNEIEFILYLTGTIIRFLIQH